jgi:hypothetical protein
VGFQERRKIEEELPSMATGFISGGGNGVSGYF